MLPPSSTTARPRYCGSQHGQLQLGQNAAHGGIVLAPVVVLGPGVEAPVRGGHAGGRVAPAVPHFLTKIGAEVARPAAIGGRDGKTPRRSRSAPLFSRMRRAARSSARSCTRMRTRSTRARCRTMSAYTHGIGANLPGQSVRSCGQRARWLRAVPIRRACGSPACARELGECDACGARFTRAIARGSARRRRCGGRAGRASCGALPPCGAGSHSAIRISSLSVGRFRDHLPERIGDKRRAPEFEAAVGRALEAHAVHRGDENAVGDGVASAGWCARRRAARRRTRAFSRGMPADGRGIKQNVRAAQAGKPRAFRIPLVPADQHADAAVARVEIGKAQIARREIEFLVVERIVGDVHLAVDARAARRRRRGRRPCCDKARRRGARRATRRSTTSQLARQLAQSFGARGRESARPDRSRSAFSSRQKYCERNSSSRQTICAPRAAASRMRLDGAVSRFAAGSVEHFRCTSPTVIFSIVFSATKEYYQIDARFLFLLLSTRRMRRSTAANMAGVKPAGLRILLAGMIAAKRCGRPPGSGNSAPCEKTYVAREARCPCAHQQAQVGVKRDRAQRQHRARLQRSRSPLRGSRRNCAVLRGVDDYRVGRSAPRAEMIGVAKLQSVACAGPRWAGWRIRRGKAARRESRRSGRR